MNTQEYTPVNDRDTSVHPAHGTVADSVDTTPIRRRPFGERQRSLLSIENGVEFPAAGRWVVCRGQLATGDRVAGGTLVVVHGPSRLDLEVVVGDATVTVSLIDANQYGTWRFAGHLLTGDGLHAIELTARYHGVFVAGACPVALLSIVDARRTGATTWRARRRSLPITLIGDLNLIAPGNS